MTSHSKLIFLLHLPLLTRCALFSDLCSTSQVLQWVLVTAFQNMVQMQVLMNEPVIAADGYTYERAALQEWLQHSTMSPVTGQMMEHTSFLPNSAIRSTIYSTV